MSTVGYIQQHFLVALFHFQSGLLKPLVNDPEFAIAKNDTVWVLDRNLFKHFTVHCRSFLTTFGVFCNGLVPTRLIHQLIEVEPMRSQKIQRRSLREEGLLLHRHYVEVEWVTLKTLGLLLVLEAANAKLQWRKL